MSFVFAHRCDISLQYGLINEAGGYGRGSSSKGRTIEAQTLCLQNTQLGLKQVDVRVGTKLGNPAVKTWERICCVCAHDSQHASRQTL